MRMRNLILAILVVLLATPVFAANGTQWTTRKNNGGSPCRMGSELGTRCFWYFDTVAQYSPLFEHGCRKVAIKLRITSGSPSMWMYTCDGTTTGECKRLEAYLAYTGGYEETAMTATYWHLKNVQDKSLRAYFASGTATGNVAIECVE